MTLTAIADHAFDAEVDVRYAAQMSSLGSLADDVLGDLARSRAGLVSTSESPAIAEALTLFDAIAASIDASSSLWRESGLGDALRRMAAAPAATSNGSAADGSASRLAGTRRALASAVTGSATEKELNELEHFFDAVSTATLETAVVAMRGRGQAKSWSTI